MSAFVVTVARGCGGQLGTWTLSAGEVAPASWSWLRSPRRARLPGLPASGRSHPKYVSTEAGRPFLCLSGFDASDSVTKMLSVRDILAGN